MWAANDSPVMPRSSWRVPNGGNHRDRPAVVAHGTHGPIPGLAADAIEHDVDAAGNHSQNLLDPFGGVVVEDFAGPEAPQVVVVGRAGHA